jgi:hypothetical protein
MRADAPETTTRGKMASLPYRILAEVNFRLWDNESQARIIAWLNALPEVQRILAADFHGEPINHENLSSWFQRDYTAFMVMVRAMAEAGPTALNASLGHVGKGKLARLPRAIQTSISRRMWDGHSHEKIAAWLNEQPIVIARMRDYFGGKPITSRNLSEWRHTGYAHWLAHPANLHRQG